MRRCDPATTTVTKLLETLKKLNADVDRGGLLKQAIGPAEHLGEIATLGRYSRELPPMLVERFRFAGEGVKAAAGQRWLERRT